FLSPVPPPPRPPRFPYTTLFRSRGARSGRAGQPLAEDHHGQQQTETRTGVRLEQEQHRLAGLGRLRPAQGREDAVVDRVVEEEQDRKSTRLNSSHVKISYAVFCL